jgi:hypothetical protein
MTTPLHSCMRYEDVLQFGHHDSDPIYDASSEESADFETLEQPNIVEANSALGKFSSSFPAM